MKVVEKKWGREQWLCLNDKYCFKKITIFAGHRTSLQYHERKIETNFVASGTAIVSLENDKGEIVDQEVGPGYCVDLLPKQIHRFAAITEVTLFECSTIEVDDVVRLQDDYNREGTSNP